MPLRHDAAQWGAQLINAEVLAFDRGGLCDLLARITQREQGVHRLGTFDIGLTIGLPRRGSSSRRTDLV